MDKRMLTIILAIALIAAFFLDWGGGVSAFDLVKSPYGNWQKYLPLIIPVAGLLLLIGAVNNGNYPLGRGLLCWLPLLTVLYILIVKPLIDGRAIGDIFKSAGDWGIGWWITIVASLVLALYNPRR